MQRTATSILAFLVSYMPLAASRRGAVRSIRGCPGAQELHVNKRSEYINKTPTLHATLLQKKRFGAKHPISPLPRALCTPRRGPAKRKNT